MRVIASFVSVGLLVAVAGTLVTPVYGLKEKPLALEGLVAIKFGKEKYVLTRAEAAKGLKFTYEIIVKKDIAGMIPLKQTSAALASPSGLLPLAKIAGKAQLYAVLDVGLGPPSSRMPKTIKKGVYKRTLKWDGKNWTGPSDFGNPKGKPFPPGEYTLSVTMIGKKKTEKGSKDYRVEGSVKVILKK